jgi:choline-glycine betaine transporter
MNIPVIIAVPFIVIGFIFMFFCDVIKKDYTEWKKLEEEVERQAKESERPHVEPLYRKKYGKRKK